MPNMDSGKPSGKKAAKKSNNSTDDQKIKVPPGTPVMRYQYTPMETQQGIPWEQQRYYQEALGNLSDGRAQCYTVARRQGKFADDVTGFMPGQEDWSQDNLPDIIYMLYPPPEWKVFKRTKPKPLLNEDGSLRYESWPDDPKKPQVMLNLPILPDVIGSQEQEWYCEIVRRIDPRVRWEDIVMRMQPRNRLKKNAAQFRLSRDWREAMRVISWHVTSRFDDNEIGNDRVIKALHAAGIPIAHNSTRGLTPGLIDPSGPRVSRNIRPWPMRSDGTSYGVDVTTDFDKPARKNAKPTKRAMEDSSDPHDAEVGDPEQNDQDMEYDMSHTQEPSAGQRSEKDPVGRVASRVEKTRTPRAVPRNNIPASQHSYRSVSQTVHHGSRSKPVTNQAQMKSRPYPGFNGARVAEGTDRKGMAHPNRNFQGGNTFNEYDADRSGSQSSLGSRDASTAGFISRASSDRPVITEVGYFHNGVIPQGIVPCGSPTRIQYGLSGSFETDPALSQNQGVSNVGYFLHKGPPGQHDYFTLPPPRYRDQTSPKEVYHPRDAEQPDAQMQPTYVDRPSLKVDQPPFDEFGEQEAPLSPQPAGLDLQHTSQDVGMTNTNDTNNDDAPISSPPIASPSDAAERSEAPQSSKRKFQEDEDDVEALAASPPRNLKRLRIHPPGGAKASTALPTPPSTAAEDTRNPQQRYIDGLEAMLAERELSRTSAKQPLIPSYSDPATEPESMTDYLNRPLDETDMPLPISSSDADALLGQYANSDLFDSSMDEI